MTPRLPLLIVALALSTLAPRCRSYSLAWQPHVTAPVFYGHADFDAAAAPAPMRVWYPSLDGAPDGAPIIPVARGRYPLVVLLHGHCAQDADHYRTWFLLPAQLARSGYVVAVPRLPQILAGAGPWNAPNDEALVRSVIVWMRTTWGERVHVMPPPATAIIGHSWGGLLGAAIVNATPSEFGAFVSLGSGLAEWPGTPPLPARALGVPALFAWGDGDVFADVGPFRAVIAAGAPAFHETRFTNANHFDHWRTNATSVTPCDSNPGSCGIVGPLTADFTAIFLSRYLPPESTGFDPATIGDDLSLPPRSLTTEQQFFAGGHLIGLSRLSLNPSCGFTVRFRTPRGTHNVP